MLLLPLCDVGTPRWLLGQRLLGFREDDATTRTDKQQLDLHRSRL
ncbi:hypothetical protein QN379_16770 [Glaciimonas sp. Gout2]|nr:MULTISPECIES: hypothetical protein [unclassified Glaciimonas]MDY7548938.1 hypothetical protein [Glaciimonas sp. CA11.2]MEB0013636.1 hypothetical protein [Glaciimonas sp. Cout2]MEB0083662.1 hypothetical protein [Glaciimonas sp. Gout2]